MSHINDEMPVEAVLSIGGVRKSVILQAGKTSVIDPTTGKSYLYIGSVNSIDELPLADCLYRMGDQILYRKFDINKALKTSQGKKIQKRRRDNSRPLSLDVKSDDDELMIKAKTDILKGMSLQQFKDMFGDKVTEMNNMLQAVEKRNTLSWKRFALLAELADKECEIKVRNKK